MRLAGLYGTSATSMYSYDDDGPAVDPEPPVVADGHAQPFTLSVRRTRFRTTWNLTWSTRSRARIHQARPRRRPWAWQKPWRFRRILTSLLACPFLRSLADRATAVLKKSLSVIGRPGINPAVQARPRSFSSPWPCLPGRGRSAREGP